jgi:hypothetical protein
MYTGDESPPNLPVVEADHSPPTNAEIKNEYSYNPPPPTHPSVCLNGVDRDNFSFTFTFTNRSSARKGVIKSVI